MIREVQSFNAQDREHRRIQGQVHVLRGYTMRRFFLASLMTMSSEITRTLGMLVVIVFGAYRVLDGTATPGDVTSFFLYIGLLLTPMEFFANLYTNLTQSAVAADRIFEFLDTRSPIQDAPNARDLQVNGPPPVVFENVKFAYPDAPDVTVLKGISFEARPGDRVVLVGGSGSGKSSMMNLLMRFYDVTDGAIRINGQDLRLITTHSLRDHIGIVPQQPILFRGTLRDNILYGRRGASDEELHEAARQANAERFILDFPNGYDTLIGERGARLSGGQAQRIAIARAFLKNPDILIMDEATSNLDATSETLVLEALDRLAEGRTTFIIAHRLSVARTANLIIVMNKGEIVERGTHEDLLALQGHYADLWNQQMLGLAREEVMVHDNL
jgi:ABC-type multidrug transport system fused ATPase/permease subunit